MKKFFSLGLALVMSACFCNFALAAETSDVQDCAYVIQVDSQEEYDRIHIIDYPFFIASSLTSF